MEMDNPSYCPLEAGDFVEKVGKTLHIGHRGFVKRVFINKRTGVPAIYVTGLPDKNLAGPDKYDGWNPFNFKKIPPVGDDRKVKLREKV